ncbi:hypothetical protein Tco_1202452 [Tanacetum coccineum]
MAIPSAPDEIQDEILPLQLPARPSTITSSETKRWSDIGPDTCTSKNHEESTNSMRDGYAPMPECGMGECNGHPLINLPDEDSSPRFKNDPDLVQSQTPKNALGEENPKMN